MIYALHEALRILFEEGIEDRLERHRRCGEALQAGLEAMGLTLFAREGYRSPPLTTVRVPEGVDDLHIRRTLLNDYYMEIGGGVGKLAGQVWRIGLMGQNATPSSVFACLSALESVLRCEGFEMSPGAGVAAAGRVLASNSN
jgi:alanine-glyoxylate transaminase/serine-glyoxylate transaminase/serine-pyruvate transaminase